MSNPSREKTHTSTQLRVPDSTVAIRIRVKSIKGEIIDRMHKKCYVEGKTVAKCVRNLLKEFKGKNPRNSINLQLVVRFRAVKIFEEQPALPSL